MKIISEMNSTNKKLVTLEVLYVQMVYLKIKEDDISNMADGLHTGFVSM